MLDVSTFWPTFFLPLVVCKRFPHKRYTDTGQSFFHFHRLSGKSHWKHPSASLNRMLVRMRTSCVVFVWVLLICCQWKSRCISIRRTSWFFLLVVKPFCVEETDLFHSLFDDGIRGFPVSKAESRLSGWEDAWKCLETQTLDKAYSAIVLLHQIVGTVEMYDKKWHFSGGESVLS